APRRGSPPSAPPRRARTAPAARTPPPSWRLLQPRDPLAEGVDPLQHDVVARTLIAEGGLDLPAHQAAQDGLQQAALADDRALGRDRPHALGLVAHGEPDLRRRDAVPPRAGGPQLLLQPLEEGGDVDRLVGHTAGV